jgi:arylsulfatase A-like enzyme
MKSTIKLISALFPVLAFTCLVPPAKGAEPKPNIIYILSDELAYFEPGFMGGKELQTPNMDRLAASGIIMKNMLSGGPNCAPARGALLTGKHSGHGSVRDNTTYNSLRAEEKTIGDVLKPLGYAVGGFGKWGIGVRGSPGVPEKHGFDEFFGYYDQAHAHTYYPMYLIRNSVEVPLPGNHGGTKGQSYSQYLIHAEAMKFLRDNAGKNPFFAYLPYTPPHGPFAIPESDPAWAIYKDKPWSQDAKLYAAMVTMEDREIGEVLDLLKERGIEKNTMVFLSGDNGGEDRFADKQHPRGLFSGNKDPNSSLEFRGGKGNPYEGSFRVSFAVTWPGHIAPGQKSDWLGYFPDVLPTIADGVSFLPTLIGANAAGHPQAEHDYFYWEKGKWTVTRQGDWCAVDAGRNKWELYNMAKDPAQTTDVAAANPEILAKLQKLAKSAHEPQRPGAIADHTLADRDRSYAKSGKGKADE